MILSWIFNFISFLILLVIIVVVTGGALFLKGIRFYIVCSGSMEPVLPTGALCLVDSQVSYEEISKGDIVVYDSVTGGKVIHRVISVSEIGLETKGDGNKSSDGVAVNEENYRGKMIGAVPNVGYFIAAVQREQKKIWGIIAVFYFGKLSKRERQSRKKGKCIRGMGK